MNHAPHISMDAPIPPGREFLSPRELAAWLGVSLRTVANLQARHVIPYIKLGRLVRFRRSQVEAALKVHTVEGIRIHSAEGRGNPTNKERIQ